MASAMMLRAEFPVHRNRTLKILEDMANLSTGGALDGSGVQTGFALTAIGPLR